MNNNLSREKRVASFQELQKSYESGLWADYPLSKGQIIQSMKAPAAKNQPLIEFHCEKTTAVASLYHHPLILVFASAKNPGGGVTRGSKAQEEDISLGSSWYFQAKEIAGFYGCANTALNSDKMLYVENALMLRDQWDNWLPEPQAVSFVGVAAPNVNGLENQRIHLSEEKIYATVQSRIENLLSLAQSKKHRTIILGAWGCGVFGLDPAKVAQAFHKVIKKNIFGGKIVFAIPNKEMLEIFTKHICIDNQAASPAHLKR